MLISEDSKEAAGDELKQTAPEAKGGAPYSTYFAFSFELPSREIALDVMGDGEVLEAASAAGSFGFLDDEEEDVYSLKDGEPVK